jgi:hypothetical protein
MNTLLSLVIHYVYGLFAQSWNGAIATVAVLIKEMMEGKAITWPTIWHAFLAGLAVNAFLYLSAHRLPDALPAGIADTPMARLRQAVNPKAVLIPSKPAPSPATPPAYAAS